MPSLKSLRVRINSVKSTQKITKAMKMVAAAKLRRAQEQAEAGRPYADRMARMLASLAAAYEAAGHLAEAIPLYEATLTDCQRVLGADHPDTLTSRNNLAGAYGAAVRPAAAAVARHCAARCSAQAR